MRISAIDIGTNTVLLLVAEVHGTNLEPIEHGYAIARLGQGVDERRNISQEAMDRVAGVLGDYMRISREQQVERIVACGTSALRDAHNRNEFLQFVKTRFGLEVMVLSGEEEAELTYVGALSEFPSEQEGEYAVIDIGGGSTEVITGTRSEVQSAMSLDIGCVRLTERFLNQTPPDPESLKRAVTMIREHSRSLPEMNRATRLVGVAGTVTTLAAIDLNLPHYDPLAVSGHVLPMTGIQQIFNRLSVKSLNELKAVPQIHIGRADIIVAGVVILIELMKLTGRDEITVSDRGLRYGLALREASK